VGIINYQDICEEIAAIDPEIITLGSLRQLPGLKNFSKDAPSKGLQRSSDGRMRYPVESRSEMYSQIKSWLHRQPALCKETVEVWNKLGWTFRGCNSTV